MSEIGMKNEIWKLIRGVFDAFEERNAQGMEGRARIAEILRRTPKGWRIMRRHEGLAPAGVVPDRRATPLPRAYIIVSLRPAPRTAGDSINERAHFNDA